MVITDDAHMTNSGVSLAIKVVRLVCLTNNFDSKADDADLVTISL